MPPPLQPSEQPASDLRQEIISRTSTLIDALSAQIDEGQRQLFMEAITKEDLPEEALHIIDSQLDNIQRLSHADPTKALQILDVMIRKGGDGTFSTEDIQHLMSGVTSDMPESMNKISGMIEKMTTMVNQLGEQLGTLGAETLKHISGFFGSNSLFGKICEYLKDQPKARIVLIEKSFNLPENTDPEKMKTLMNTINNNANAINRKDNPAPPYDFVEHVKEIRENIESEASITVDKISEKSNNLKAEYLVGTKTLPSATPSPTPAIAAEPKKDRERKEVTTTLETKIANDDASLMIVEKIADGARLEINGKKAEIKKIGESAVTSVAILEASATDPAAVILTLADATTVQIDATALKVRALDTSKGNVHGKNITTNSDVSFEVLFA